MSTRISNSQDLTGGYQQIYISPHIDDAALSCGGAIAQHIANNQRVLVVTMCTAGPPNGAVFSPMAEELHRNWGSSGVEAMVQRRHEDVTAMELLGADYIWLDLLDAIYRMPERYNSRESLFGTPDAADPLANEVAITLRMLRDRCPDATIYAPLGVGSHVDHLITYTLLEGMARAGGIVAFYEDFPYVRVAGSLEQRLAVLGGNFVPSTLDIDDTLARKISSVDAYVSQMGELFGDSDAMVAAVTNYAESLRPQDRTYAERVWLLLPAEG